VSVCAETLAETKAAKIAQTAPDALVIGADQMLEADGRWFDKPPTLAAARDQLLTLAGKTHTLPTAVVIMRGDQRIWHHVATPRLTMRAFGAAFVDRYLAEVGTKALSSVGAYQLEGPGAQLFDRIDGDFFTILGLPLLPLLAFLREQHVIPA
jgi:septum formation protein